MSIQQKYSPTILVTGASGMIGKRVVKALLDKEYRVIGVDKYGCDFIDSNYNHVILDLSDENSLIEVIKAYPITHTIHLAALAHTKKGESYSKTDYYQANVINAIHVFQCCKETNVLFISTVDVFGFVKKSVDSDKPVAPVTIYGKTKLKAEQELRQIATHYNIYRFSPVYSEEMKRDIQKRYYLKYPDWAYIIGKGSEYEVLHIDKAVKAMVDWIDTEPDGKVYIIKDDIRMNTTKVLEEEKVMGNAKYVIRFPRWLVVVGYYVARITGKNKYTFLLNKALYPLRSN